MPEPEKTARDRPEIQPQTKYYAEEVLGPTESKDYLPWMYFQNRWAAAGTFLVPQRAFLSHSTDMPHFKNTFMSVLENLVSSLDSRVEFYKKNMFPSNNNELQNLRYALLWMTMVILTSFFCSQGGP